MDTGTRGLERWRCLGLGMLVGPAIALATEIGAEKAALERLEDGMEYAMSAPELVRLGRQFFAASWTVQEGAGRPLTKGTGDPLSDAARRLDFPFNFNRVSAPDANSCAGCHNLPAIGGGGDIVANVFVLGQRFDFATFDGNDALSLRGTTDETGGVTTLQSIANSRGTIGMNGSGYIELLARQMTAELQRQRDRLAPGTSTPLQASRVSFGTLFRRADGTYDVSAVEGLPAASLAGSVPNLILRPFHQASAVISLRQFTNNAMNHHHGIQSTERFGPGDPDGDGFVNEMTRAEVTATTIFQAALPVPVRVIPREREIERAVETGEERFVAVGCAECHRPWLLLDDAVFTEPNPYNPAGNLRPGEVDTPVAVDLNDRHLPGARLRSGTDGKTRVPAFTDLKLHRIYAPGSPNCEPLDQSGPGPLSTGNCAFLTRKLWGLYSEPGFGHHGQFTTMREAINAHGGEAELVMRGYRALSPGERDAIIEFLKSLRIVPETVKAAVVDERGLPRPWREFPWTP